MLNRRVIPKLMLKRMVVGPQTRKVLVTTVGFSKTISVGEPVSQARIYEAQLADELIFLDLDGSIESDPSVLEVLRSISEQIFLPLTAGGGVRTLEGMRQLLRNGADKVSFNTAALSTPEILTRGADTFGSQAVVLSIDYRTEADGRRVVYADGGKRATDWEPVAWAREGEKRGAGEILLTSIDRDGTRQGLDLATASEICQAVSLPVILSGGCGLAQHFVEGFTEGRANAIAAGTFFCFKDENPMQARSRIRNAGVPIRVET